jgi:hypothetical protein
VPADRPAGVIALVGGRVVTMRDAANRQEVIDDGVVIWSSGNRIDSVGRRDDVTIPDGARRFDVAARPCCRASSTYTPTAP